MRRILSPEEDMGGIRPEILRRYYEATFGKQGPSEEAFQGATFEEYFDLYRIAFPAVSRYQAATSRRNRAFLHMADRFAHEQGGPMAEKAASASAPPPNRAEFRRKPEVDLAAQAMDENIESLLLDRVKMVKGWKGLLKLKRLRRLSLILCDTEEEAPDGKPIKVEEVAVNECSQRALEVALAITRTRIAKIHHLESATVDLSPLRDHRELGVLLNHYGFALGLGSLKGLPLEKVHLADAVLDGEFRKALFSWKETLVALSLMRQEPFAPSDLPVLPGLRRMKVPAYSEFRTAWIDHAVANPKIRFEFPPQEEPPAKAPRAKVAGIHRDIAILKVAKGSKGWHEAWSDFTGLAQVYKGLGNHDLRDKLETWAKQGKVKAEFASEADELLIKASSMETVKACIDALLDGKA